MEKRIDLKAGFDIEKMDETSVKTIEVMEKAINEGLENYIKGLNIEDSFESIKTAINEVKGMKPSESIVKRIEAIEDAIVKSHTPNNKEKGFDSVNAIADKFKSFVTTDANGRKYVDFKSALERGDVVMELDKKAATTMLANGGSTHVSADRNISTPAYRPWLFDIATVTKATGPNTTYIDKSAPEGTPAFVTEGGEKPLISWTYEQKVASAKKIAVVSKYSTELAMDVENFVEELSNDLSSQVKRQTEHDILEGNGSNLTGVVAGLPSYQLTTIKVDQPNTYDAIVAAATQIKSSTFGSYVPTHVLLNPQDFANMRLTKNADGDYIIPVENGNLTVIESATRPVGSLLIGDFSKLNIKVWVEMALIFGHENDDIRKNLMTVAAETRIAAYVKSSDKLAFVNDTIADIIGAITATA